MWGFLARVLDSTVRDTVSKGTWTGILRLNSDSFFAFGDLLKQLYSFSSSCYDLSFRHVCLDYHVHLLNSRHISELIVGILGK